MQTLYLRGMAALFAVGVATPALADHGIAGGGVSGSGPIVTVEAETLPAGKFAAGVSARYTRPDAYSDAELIALASVNVDAHTTDYNLGLAASLAYGLSDRLMVSASLPVVYRAGLREGEHGGAAGVVEDIGSVSGVGDLALLGQYRLAGGNGWAVALLGGLKVPTGATGAAAPDGHRLETEHQIGTGSWDPLFGLAASKGWGRWSVHGSTLYQVSTQGAQDTRLGDRLNLSAAAVLGLTPEHAHAEGAEHSDHHDPAAWAAMVEASYEWEGRQRVAGTVDGDSGAKVLWLSPGLRFTSPAGWSAGLSAGVPLWQDVRPSHPDNAFRLVAQVGTAF